MRQPIRGSTSIAPPRRVGLIGAVAVLVLFCALIALRAAVLYEVTNGLADCPICMAATAAQQDASLCALLLVFTGLAFLTRRYWLQLPWLLLSACLIFVYAIDATVTKTLTQRLYLFDVIKFGKELSAITRFSNIFLETAAGKLALVVALVGIAVLVLAALPRPSRPRTSIYCFVAAVPLALLGRWQPPTMQYIHNELLLNLLAANLNLGVDKPYSAAFEKKIAEEYAPRTKVMTVESADGLAGGQEAMRHILDSGFKPTAIACVNDFMAVGALRELHVRGASVPGDMSVTGFDNVALSEFAVPALTTADVPRETIGRLICDALIPPAGEDQPLPRTEMVVETQLIVRESTAPPRSRTVQQGRRRASSTSP